MDDGTLLVERSAGLATIRFADPDHMNALGDRMREAFVAAMTAAIEDGKVRAILICGTGRAFCAGADLKEMAGTHARGEAPPVGAMLRESINPLLTRMAEAPKPIVAAVNGAAVGVGCGIALAADIVLIGESGYFMQSFARIGVVPDGGSTWSIPRLAGWGRAGAMMLLGERIDARTAVDWGLAYRAYPDEVLFDEARAMASALANGPTRAYAGIKAMLRLSAGSTLAGQLGREADFQEAAFATRDCREGIAAFTEKRPPAFRGC